MQFSDKIPIPESIVNRKGPRTASEILPDVSGLLNSGRIETVNLTEWSAVDHLTLLRHVLVEFGMLQHADAMLSALEQIKRQSTMKVIPAIAGEWLKLICQQTDNNHVDLFEQLAIHQSDSVRCWAAFVVGLDQLELERKLASIRPFAADHHFGVREIAWMAVRDSVSRQLQLAIRLLSSWVRESDANLRRFAIELTRPRGVWARHIAELKDNPELGLPLLEPLKADPSKYVQDSVANWLNDAAKSRPDWVVQVCHTWMEVSDKNETKRIVARAQRSIKH
ncbi:3-methyladenine DNA glycosylase AlkC [Fontibacillus solani]|uniref:3-methyladenine DNA glycosylase AlkC n=1 Tax=Fontibacillus solani TaxID=1572857 RepID=A0A7W3XS39_9BACL|nr:DNA alkylation repair protein [Fontibacillus solani]MBA9086179.1 3-methyladenine DNA glycosylase AlkC [Fontibacillus solani]